MGHVLSLCKLPHNISCILDLSTKLCVVVFCFVFLPLLSPEMSVSYRGEEGCWNVLPNKSGALRGNCNFVVLELFTWSATPKNGKTSLFHAHGRVVNKKLSKNTIGFGRDYHIWQEICLQITHKTTRLPLQMLGHSFCFCFFQRGSKGFPQF